MPRIGFQEWMAMAAPIARGRLVRYGYDNDGEVDRFEKRLAEQMGVAHTLTVSSGTSALICALAAARIGPGDEVITPAYTWVATAAAPLAVGAVPVLANIDTTLTVDPTDLERRITPQTKAVIVVHMGNAVCNMDAILQIARQHNILVIEDACQAVGVKYKDRRVGTIGSAGAFSFNAYKNMNSAEGGAVMTNDPQLYVRARMFHDCGDFGRGRDTYNEAAFVGQNYKANELQAAILNVQLRKLDGYVRLLQSRRRLLAPLFEGRSDCIITPHNDPDNAASLSLLFHTEDDAIAFSRHRFVARLLDNSKHVFTHWESILSQRSFHPKMNPWAWAARPIDYGREHYARTLDIQARTCRIELGSRAPTAALLAYFSTGARRRPAQS